MRDSTSRTKKLKRTANKSISSSTSALFITMKPFAIFIIAVCFAFMQAAASNVSLSDVAAPDPKYSVVDLSWAIESVPGNATSTIILNGTVQEVYNQLTKMNPDYDDLLRKHRSSKATASLPDSVYSFDSMDDLPRSCGYCNVCTKRWKPAAYMITLDGVNHLNNLTGKPANGPGPGACGRVSCEWGSSIWWCNDSDERKELDSWHEIASATEDITRQCSWTQRDHSLVTGGQIFQPDGWNVVVRHDENDY